MAKKPNDQQEALKQDAGEETSVSESPAEKPKATEEVKTEPVVAEPTGEAKAGEVKTEPVDKVSSKKGAQSRIRELNSEAKLAKSEAEEAKKKVKSLSEQLRELTGPVGQQAGMQPTPIPPAPGPTVRPGEEIDYGEYERRQAERDNQLVQRAAAIASLESKKSEAINRINNESMEAIREYPELDPDNSSFDKELSESVTEATINYVKANPYSASPKKFVDKLMKPYKRSVAKQVGQASENIAKQVSQAASRPTGVSKGKTDYQDKSIKELEQELGIKYY